MGGFQNPNLITICIIIIIISTICSTTGGSSSSSSSIYDALRSNGLPIGILPKGVTNFTIDPINGHFEAHLEQACDSKFETQVRYDLNISGTLLYGQIAELSGMAAQELFLWFPVKGIRVDIPSSGIIYFDVGVIFKQYSLSLFETPRDCDAVGPLLPPPELISFDGRGRIVENHSGKLVNKIDPEIALRTFS